MKATMAKLQAVTARIALVLQVCADQESTSVTHAVMCNAIQISRWFESQARMVYESISAKAADQVSRIACEWIAKQGGATTVRELMHKGPNSLRAGARKALEDLVAAGRVKKTPQTGKRGDLYSLDCLAATATVATD
jgi:hypothetical protein